MKTSIGRCVLGQSKSGQVIYTNRVMLTERFSEWSPRQAERYLLTARNTARPEVSDPVVE